MPVSGTQRFSRSRPCPICGGYEEAPRGRSTRCFGFRSEDGLYAHCTREEQAGALERHPESETYGHRLAGACRCGVQHGPPAPGGNSTSQIVATYNYTDERGDLLFQVVRYSPKAFRQRRPDDGGFIWNLNGVRRVPYNLPQVIEAPAVFFPEGEKDCQTLGRWGWVATTCPGGAGKWRDEYCQFFRSKRVAILPDADEPGRRHALQIAHSLLGVAGSVRVVEPPGVKDVTAWVEKGGTKEGLSELVKQAPELDAAGLAELERKWFPLSHGTGPKCITSLSELPSVWGLELDLEWLVQEFLATGSVNLLSAESDTGKTWLAYFIAGAVAQWHPILGREVRQRKVLYLDGENPLYVVKQRLFDLGIKETPELKIWGGWNDSPPPGPNSPIVQQFAREHQPLIVYDSLIEFHPGSEQSSNETRDYMRRFRTLANLGGTVLVLHNCGKAETAKPYRGSSDIKASVDMAYELKKVPEHSETLEDLSIKCFKGRLGPVRNFGMRFERGVGFVPSERSEDHSIKTTHEVVEDILLARPGSNQGQVVELARDRGLSKHQTEAALKSGPWRTDPGRGREILYYAQDEEFEVDRDLNSRNPAPKRAGIRELTVTC